MKSYHHFMLFAALTASLLIVAGSGARESSQADYPEGAFEPTQPRTA